MILSKILELMIKELFGDSQERKHWFIEADMYLLSKKWSTNQISFFWVIKSVGQRNAKNSVWG